jgi:hypothetical protein
MTDTSQPKLRPTKKMTTAAQRAFLAQAARARDLPDAYLDCRSLGHAWQECEPDRPAKFGELHVYQCLRCLGIRDDLISHKYGEILSRGYRHAPGYMQPVPEDGTRLYSAAALRAERRRRRLEMPRNYPAVRQWDEHVIDPQPEPTLVCKNGRKEAS